MKRLAKILTSIFIISIVTGLLGGVSQVKAEYEQKAGVVQDDPAPNDTGVNVRVDAGTVCDKLLDSSNNNILLNTGHEVTVIGEKTASDGSLWYQINFDYNNGNYTGYMHSRYVIIKVDDEENKDGKDEEDNEDDPADITDFDTYLEEQGFPDSYKNALKALHEKYPKWVFVADHLNYDFSTVLNNQCNIGRSLVPKYSISSWKSLQTGAYNWQKNEWVLLDTSGWVQASKEIIAYSLDPRNFLNETSIFMFELLSADTTIHSKTGVETIISGSFMDGRTIENSMLYSSVIMEAGNISKVSPYHIASKLLNEQGYNGTSAIISGTNATYPGIYNYFNWKAAGTGNAWLMNGLAYASQNDPSTLRPWNTRYKSIVGGAIMLGGGYISVGQDTQYYEKFDFVGTPYTHQYMTNVLAPASLAITMSKSYSEEQKQSTGLVFKIPVMNNMPEAACEKPTGNGSPNCLLNSLSITGQNITPSFYMFTYNYDVVVPYAKEIITLNAVAIDTTSTVSGTGQKTLQVGKNTFKIVVKSTSGATSTYVITVVREKATQEELEDKTTTYEIQGYTATDKYLSGIAINSTLNDIKSKISVNNGSIALLNSDRTVNNGKVKSGDIVMIKDINNDSFKEFIVVLRGDINGDGTISIIDMHYLKQYILGIDLYTDYKAKAADIDASGKIELIDLHILKQQVIGNFTIVQ